MSSAIVCSVIFSVRFDYSVYPQPWQIFDSSAIAYGSFLRMEINDRHPVVHVFVDMIPKKYSRSSRRWALFYTLIRNEQLKSLRKHRMSNLIEEMTDLPK